jgi:hypothetical protein
MYSYTKREIQDKNRQRLASCRSGLGTQSNSESGFRELTNLLGQFPANGHAITRQTPSPDSRLTFQVPVCSFHPPASIKLHSGRLNNRLTGLKVFPALPAQNERWRCAHPPFFTQRCARTLARPRGWRRQPYQPRIKHQ